MDECWAGTRWFSRSAGSWSSGEKKMSIKLNFFAKIDVVTIDIELASLWRGQDSQKVHKEVSEVEGAENAPRVSKVNIPA